MPRPNRGPHLWLDSDSGIWHVRDFQAGRRILRSTGERDRRRAEALLAQAIIELQQPKPPPQPSVADILDLYSAARAETHSAKQLGNSCRQVRAVLGWLPAGDVKAAHIRTYIARRREAGRADGTIAEELRKLRAALRWAAGEGFVSMPRPWTIPLRVMPRDRWLTQEEADALVASAVEPHARLYLMMALHTAARSSAILELPWKAVDLERRIVAYPAKVGGKRRVAVPINDTLLQALQEAREHATTEWVIEYGGKRVTRMNGGWRGALHRSGIAHCTRHDLRRTAGSLMLQSGVPLELVSAVLGHRSTEITRAVYAHLAVEHLRSAMDALVTAGTDATGQKPPHQRGQMPASAPVNRRQ